MSGGTFPTSIPSYSSTSGSETPNTAGSGTGLSGLLNNFETDITALGTKIGTGSSTPTNNTVLVGNGVGTSAWASTLTSFTLVTPTIASFVNANHDHSNAANGGNIVAGAIPVSAITPEKILSGTGTTWPWTTWAPAGGGFASKTVDTGAYIQVGKTAICRLTVDGTSNSTGFTFVLPVAAKATEYITGLRVADNGSFQTVPGMFITTAASTTATMYKTGAAASTDWTAANAKAVYGSFSYEVN